MPGVNEYQIDGRKMTIASMNLLDWTQSITLFLVSPPTLSALITSDQDSRSHEAGAQEVEHGSKGD